MSVELDDIEDSVLLSGIMGLTYELKLRFENFMSKTLIFMGDFLYKNCFVF